MKSSRSIALLIGLLIGTFGSAQTDPLVEALRKFQSGDLAGARTLVDEAVRTPQHVDDPEAWLLRGFIYKDTYKDMEAGKEADVLRDEAVASLFTCLNLDTVGTYRQNATQAYDFLTRSYYNDAARALNELDEQRALGLFDKYRTAVLRMDPKADLRARQIEFTNALGTVYTKRFGQDRTVTGLFDKAVAAYQQVLEMDPENYGANYNLATLYYNRGVEKIRGISADDDIPSIHQIQAVSREFFQQALPFMIKAHEMNPSRRETLLGLEGIYYSLQDQESSDKYRRLFEELPPQEQR
ncbi:MAG: tetratricopeptide repeat protein [Flavobacteriales bacterium]|nr:tetratricopeptide repeat protein [Flavobacteriales bacterium]